MSPQPATCQTETRNVGNVTLDDCLSHLVVEVGEGGGPAVCVVQSVPVTRGIHHSQGEPHTALLQLDLDTKHQTVKLGTCFRVANKVKNMTKSLEEIDFVISP